MYDASYWNERYGVNEYVYGTKPNTFLAEHCGMLSGPVLSLSEGEGRNAVFLAARGLEVLGVDLSDVALAKANQLAQSQGVKIQTLVADLGTYTPKPEHFGSVISISAHVPSAIRRRLYPLVEQALRPGGIFLLESYSENQLARDTGGPKDRDLLMTVDKIRREFTGLETIHLCEIERHIAEGDRHTGMASVVQFIGRKKA